MCEGPSSICGPIPPDPSLFPQYYQRPASALGRLEGNKHGTSTLLPGPLAPDPVLHPDYYNNCASARRPRINANASHIWERGQRGVIRELLKVECFPTTEISKPKMRELNFHKDNVRRLREIQKRCKVEAERARSVPVKALWTSTKYRNVQSKFMVDLQVTSPAVKPECQNFLKGHSKNKVPPRPQSTPAAGTLHHSHTAKQDKNLQVKGQIIDFIKYNARAARQTMQRSQSLTNLQDKTVPSAIKGQVPHYIEERKKQCLKEEEEERRKKLIPPVPVGHTLMADSERQQTLKTLQERHHTLVTELLLLPLKADNLSVRSRRARLDNRLSELEEAIKIFSRDKVYVKTNS
ncbi:enkurin domain-containing protein 1 [Syngnathus typhle]|uniref:enkurin domain-containing protein 1 n=1 Tax=Syngnathus typhle TaxID=161592 RepID=UPI002A6A975A|nr:enkurin domain-containing protein 1 [Syngnathus typhle]XP_061135220.1 enkurin domain-containing protein 1 [Syngnathus typhle]